MSNKPVKKKQKSTKAKRRSPSAVTAPSDKKARSPERPPSSKKKDPVASQPPSSRQVESFSHTSAHSFPIVGIGSSAGGLDALSKFFGALPAETGLGYVVVQHLAPDHKSLMPELLARKTPLPIHVAEDRMCIEPNQIYVLPPNSQMTIQGGLLRVVRPSQEHGLRSPIDIFFHSLAIDQENFAVGVILSGAGSDGAVGLRAIKEHGGLTIAQVAESAQFASMPRSAIVTGMVDHILSLEDIPPVLIDYAKFLYDLRDGKGLKTLGFEALENLDLICAHLHKRTGHDFRQYKRNTLSRRVQRRMQILHMASITEYVKRLQESSHEADDLFKELLIGVTHFFRDPETFEFFSKTIVPKIVKSKKNGEPIRIWVPGCSTGEEVYSLAILFYEYLYREKLSIPLQIFGTDIDERALEFARRGHYPKSIHHDVLPERLSMFFEPVDSFYQIGRGIRDSCIFSFHNLVGNPPFSRMDVISCRNLLIYMESTLQNQMFSVFHYSLNPDGYLFLGASEHAGDQSRLFRPLHKRFRVFQPKEVPDRRFPSFPIQGPRANPPGQKTTLFPQVRDTITHIFDRLVRQEYGPAAVLIDKDSQVHYISGQTRAYLQLPSGTVDVNLINMAVSGLRLPLRSAIFKAVKTGKEVVHDHIRLPVNDRVHVVDIIVRPLFQIKDGSDLLMVIFCEKGMPQKTSAIRKKHSPDVSRTVRELEQEIQATREHLQTAMEDVESSNEELKSSNQELMSVNEELQAANEELQTSTEELQSINEELETVNAQLSGKIEELDRANCDMENLFQSTDIATIFFNDQLCIQKYTPAAQRIFQFLDTDCGRPITQLATFIQDETLAADIQNVLRTSKRNEQTRRFSQGPQLYYSRITPYQSHDDQVQGAVLTLVDITHLSNVESQVARFSERQKVLARLGQFALQERDMSKVLNECTKLLGAVLGVELVEVLELSPDEQFLILRAGRGWREGLVGHAVVAIARNSQEEYILSVDAPVVVEDFSQEARFSPSPLLSDYEVVSGMSCILRDREGKPHGILGVHTLSKREFVDEDVKFLQTLANILASALHRNHIETQLQAMKASLESRVEERTQELMENQVRLRRLSSEFVLAEHRERRRIAIELHDYLGQLLVVGKLKISQLQQGTLSDDQLTIFKEIEEALDEALTYTRDLISQVSPPVLYDFGLVPAIRWLCEKMLRYDLRVTLTCSIAEEDLTFSETTTVFIYQVVRELLFNVLKHAQTLEACVEITQDSMEFMCFEVRDQGCGFDLSREKRGPLQHFGLLNAQERVEGLGGHLEVHSKIGEGTRVRIAVPRGPEKAESAHNTDAVPIVASVVRTAGDHAIRVVLADDHSIFRDGLRTLLHACHDIQVVAEAENGKEAVDLVQTHQPDVVVMDINMPVMHGIEATRLIKEAFPATYVIGLSMYSDKTMTDAFFAAGGAHYVCKGDSFNTFAEIIRASKP